MDAKALKEAANEEYGTIIDKYSEEVNPLNQLLEQDELGSMGGSVEALMLARSGSR